MSAALFSPGLMVITPSARDRLHPEDVALCVTRHLTGDWGELCEEDRMANQTALAQGGRLFSVYRDRANIKFYVISEADRSATTVLLPEDY